jgi:hypothetical protein
MKCVEQAQKNPATTSARGLKCQTVMRVPASAAGAHGLQPKSLQFVNHNRHALSFSIVSGQASERPMEA